MSSCWFRLIRDHAAIVADDNRFFERHSTTRPISKVVHDKVPLVREVIANEPRLRIGCACAETAIRLLPV